MVGGKADIFDAHLDQFRIGGFSARCAHLEMVEQFAEPDLGNGGQQFVLRAEMPIGGGRRDPEAPGKGPQAELLHAVFGQRL